MGKIMENHPPCLQDWINTFNTQIRDTRFWWKIILKNIILEPLDLTWPFQAVAHLVDQWIFFEFLWYSVSFPCGRLWQSIKKNACFLTLGRPKPWTHFGCFCWVPSTSFSKAIPARWHIPIGVLLVPDFCCIFRQKATQTTEIPCSSQFSNQWSGVDPDRIPQIFGDRGCQPLGWMKLDYICPNPPFSIGVLSLP